MPCLYAHTRFGWEVVKRSGYDPADPLVFNLGLQGGDPFFSYVFDERIRKVGDLIHDVDCGFFLKRLWQRAETPRQRDLAVGHLLHYTLDCTMHPLMNKIAATRGGIYHGYIDVLIDLYLIGKDKPDGKIWKLLPEKVPWEVGYLLSKVVNEVYGCKISPEDYERAVEVMRRVTRFVTTWRPLKKPLVYALKYITLGKVDMQRMFPPKEAYRVFAKEYLPYMGRLWTEAVRKGVSRVRCLLSGRFPLLERIDYNGRPYRGTAKR